MIIVEAIMELAEAITVLEEMMELMLMEQIASIILRQINHPNGRAILPIIPSSREYDPVPNKAQNLVRVTAISPDHVAADTVNKPCHSK